MHPSAGSVRMAADSGDGIACAGVNIAGLSDDESRAAEGRQQFGAEPALVIDWDFNDAVAAQTEDA